MSVEEYTIIEAFDALAEPNRRRILELLRGDEQTVGALVTAMQLSQPAVSKHLKALREAGFVDVRRDGQRRWYRLRVEPLKQVEAWLRLFQPIWAERLDGLEKYLDSEE